MFSLSQAERSARTVCSGVAASDSDGDGHRRFDVIVVGAGIMGSCAAASRGPRVLLLERFDRLHVRGSSHGESRGTRSTYAKAYYTPMLRLERRLWDEAQAEAGDGDRVLTPTPHLDVGPRDDPSLLAAVRNGGASSIEVVEGSAWPGADVFRVPDGWMAAASELGGVIQATKAPS